MLYLTKCLLTLPLKQPICICNKVPPGFPGEWKVHIINANIKKEKNVCSFKLTSAQQSVCQPQCLSTWKSVSLSICRPVNQNTSLFVYLSTCDLSTSLPTDLSTCLPVDQSTCLPVDLSTSQYVYLSTSVNLSLSQLFLKTQIVLCSHELLLKHMSLIQTR